CDHPAVAVEVAQVVRRTEPNDRLTVPDVEAAAEHDRLAALRQVEVVVAALRELPQAGCMEKHRPVAALVRLAQSEGPTRVAVETRPRKRHDAHGVERARARLGARGLSEHET